MVTSDPIDMIAADQSVKSTHLPLLLEAETAAENETEGEKKAEKPKRVTHVRQLFVGNLPFRVRWQDLKDLFRKAGNVQRADVALSFDNRSKGHGTVLFATVEDAQRAIDMLHNYKWQGRVLEVREDRGFVGPSQHIQLQLQHQQQQLQQQLHQQRMVENMRMNNAEIVSGGRQLFVGNLPFHCQWQDVKDLFRNAGNILRADVVQGPDGRSRGFGTVLFATHEDAKKAMAMYNGFEFHGRQLRVHFDKFAPGPLPHHHQPPSAPRFTLGPATFRPRPNFAYMQPPPLPYPMNFPSPLTPSTPPIIPSTSPTASTIRLQQHLQSLATENRPRLLQHPFYSTPATLHQPQQYRQPYLPPPFEEPLGNDPILSTNPLVGSIGMAETIYSTAADSEIRPIFMHPWQSNEHKDEAFFSPPPPQRPPSLPISPDEELADAIKVISLTDGSAGLTTTTTTTSSNSDVTAQANLLTSNSVWEPLSGFKY